ncbi:hypothetical protein GGR28_002841 [Lewinella aquimaris]|uniref:Uncharacterized protein n=1 Tax=Neolewinella aquimaris TaxID=1835722 RepID=A0A840E4V2_9BACT|nr:hypothetical protein [Neolewinella aquimaris]MBB4080211.1 hypothetical protein [Neolewinella aquimaris]
MEQIYLGDNSIFTTDGTGSPDKAPPKRELYPYQRVHPFRMGKGQDFLIVRLKAFESE